MKKIIGNAFLGVGLAGIILSCLTMNAEIKTAAVIVLILSLAIETVGLMLINLAEKRDALSGQNKVYHISTEDSRINVWMQWKYNCNLTAKARRGWGK